MKLDRFDSCIFAFDRIKIQHRFHGKLNRLWNKHYSCDIHSFHFGIHFISKQQPSRKPLFNHYFPSTLTLSKFQRLFFLFFPRYLNDPNTYNIDQQFLIGRALLVSPNLLPVMTYSSVKVNAFLFLLIQESSTVRGYIPQDTWYEFPSGVPFKTVGQFLNLDAPIQKINVHVRGGFIIPMQTPGSNLILGRRNPFQLLVASSPSGNASGTLFWDDGDSIGSCISSSSSSSHIYS